MASDDTIQNPKIENNRGADFLLKIAFKTFLFSKLTISLVTFLSKSHKYWIVEFTVISVEWPQMPPYSTKKTEFPWGYATNPPTKASGFQPGAPQAYTASSYPQIFPRFLDISHNKR